MDSLKEIFSGTDHRSLQPGSRPVIKKINEGQLFHTLDIRDEKHPGKLLWPGNASHLQVWVKVGGAPDADPGEYRFADDFKTLKARLHFVPADQGKTVHYLLRWVNSSNIAGPWSKVYSAVIR